MNQITQTPFRTEECQPVVSAGARLAAESAAQAGALAESAKEHLAKAEARVRLLDARLAQVNKMFEKPTAHGHTLESLMAMCTELDVAYCAAMDVLESARACAAAS